MIKMAVVKLKKIPDKYKIKLLNHVKGKVTHPDTSDPIECEMFTRQLRSEDVVEVFMLTNFPGYHGATPYDNRHEGGATGNPRYNYSWTLGTYYKTHPINILAEVPEFTNALKLEIPNQKLQVPTSILTPILSHEKKK